jgi:UDPglucose 6-dehydrogenase
MGHRVTCIDKDEAKVALLRDGGLPIYEPGLDQLVHRNVARERLDFTTDGPAAIGASQVSYIAVGTPPADDGSADLSGVMAVAELIGKSAQGPLTVIIKSTVPVGTADRVRAILTEHCAHPFDVVSNPEFLKEGAAIDDFMKPDRIVVGCAKEETRDVVRKLYGPLLRTGKPILFMDNRSAELSKYTANAFLATKISFINEVARLCEQVGADVDSVRRGAGTDSRIGLRFFFPGIGYGGSCFPKDVQALAHTGREYGQTMSIIEAVEDVNAGQKRILGDRVLAALGPDLRGMRIAFWGLSFKPRTDDMREAPSLVTAAQLRQAGASVVAYDPEAIKEARHMLGDTIDYAQDRMSALDGADALLLLTEWNEFRDVDWAAVSERMRGRHVFDGRNIYDPAEVRASGLTYYGIGRL